MKKVLSLIAALAVLALAASALAAEGKTLKLAMDADPESLDPHVQLSGGMLQYSHMAFDPLVRWDQKMQIEPRLAESWEQVNPTTLRFHLRKGVKFHSGNPLTAKDVVWTLERLKKSEDFKGLFEPFEKAAAVDDYTVDLVTKEPYGLALAMSTYIFPLDSVFYSGADENGQPKDAIVKTGPSFANSHVSGTGPFKVTEREHGVKLLLDRNPDYWDKKCPGNVSQIVFTPIKEDATRVAALLSGDVDYIQPVPPQDLKRIGEDPKIDLVTMPGTRIITIQLNEKRREEFKNPKVREAVNLAINNEGVVKTIMKGDAVAAGQLSPKGYAGYNPALTPRYDLEKAQKLMKEAGYEKGFEVTMIAPNNRYVNDEKIAEAIVGMLAKIGIKVNLKTMPKAQYWDEYDKQVADIQMVGWHSDTEDSANFYEYLVMCPNKDTGMGQYNSSNYCNPKLDEIVIASRSETDPAKRAKMLQDVEKIIFDENGIVPLHWQNLSWVAKKGVNIRPIVNVMDFPYFGDLVIQ